MKRVFLQTISKKKKFLNVYIKFSRKWFSDGLIRTFGFNHTIINEFLALKLIKLTSYFVLEFEIYTLSVSLSSSHIWPQSHRLRPYSSRPKTYEYELTQCMMWFYSICDLF